MLNGYVQPANYNQVGYAQPANYNQFGYVQPANYNQVDYGVGSVAKRVNRRGQNAKPDGKANNLINQLKTLMKGFN